MELNQKNLIKLVLALFAVVLFYLLMNHLGVIWRVFLYLFDVAFPIILGCCIAFLLNIPMRAYERQLGKLEKKRCGKFFQRHKRGIALVLTLLSVVGVLAFMLGILVPQLAVTVAGMPDTFRGFWNRVVAWANENEWLHTNIVSKLKLEKIDWKQVWESVNSFVFSGAGTVLSASISFATSLVSGVVDFFLAICFAVYILFQKDRLGVQMKKILYAFLRKDRAERVLQLSVMVEETFSNFFAVQCLEALILGCMFFVSMTLLRFPYALPISLLIAVTALIPICGAFIGCVIGVFLIVMVDPMRAVWFVVLFLALQQIEGNFIYPRVVGSSVGLPALWVLAAITIGGSLLGIVGMLIFVPLFSVLYVLLRETVVRRLKRKQIRVTDDGRVKCR